MRGEAVEPDSTSSEREDARGRSGLEEFEDRGGFSPGELSDVSEKALSRELGGTGLVTLMKPFESSDSPPTDEVVTALCGRARKTGSSNSDVTTERRFVGVGLASSVVVVRVTGEDWWSSNCDCLFLKDKSKGSPSAGSDRDVLSERVERSSLLPRLWQRLRLEVGGLVAGEEAASRLPPPVAGAELVW